MAAARCRLWSVFVLIYLKLEMLFTVSSLSSDNETSIQHYHQPLSLLSASADKSMMIWRPDGETGVWLNQVRVGDIGGMTMGFYGGLWSSDGRKIMAHGWNGAFHLWTDDDGMFVSLPISLSLNPTYFHTHLLITHSHSHPMPFLSRSLAHMRFQYVRVTHSLSFGIIS
jgi:hypothetical protein